MTYKIWQALELGTPLSLQQEGKGGPWPHNHKKLNSTHNLDDQEILSPGTSRREQSLQTHLDFSLMRPISNF